MAKKYVRVKSHIRRTTSKKKKTKNDRDITREIFFGH